jgi:hypothetical protein
VPLITPDIAYAFFCFGAAVFSGMSAWKLFKDKQVRGAHYLEPVWVTLWGFTNFYVFWGNPLSIAANVALNAANVLKFTLMVYYNRKERASNKVVD